MRIARPLAALAATFVSSAGAPAADAPPNPATLDAVLRELEGVDHPGCTIGVMQDGALVYSAARGAFDIEARTPLAADTVFNIGSISKQFTAFAVLLLAQQGKLSLDDSIRRHIPELGSYADAVTLRHLLHHVGGLRDYIGLLRLEGHPFTRTTTREDALRVLSRQSAPNAPPGVEYDYSNTGYFLLSVVVERLSGTSLARFSKKQIFDPLGMRDTSIVDRYPTGIARLARGYQETDKRYVVDGTLWEQVGDGQVHTTVADLAKWSDNFVTGRVGGKALIARMSEPYRVSSGRLIQYGAGIGLGTYRGLRTLRHSGDWAGFHAYLLVFPEQRFAASALCNSLQSDPSRYTHEMADLYLASALGKPETADEIVALRGVEPRADVSKVPAGLYRNSARASYVMLVQQESAAALAIGSETYRLQAIEPRLYQVGEPDDELYSVFVPPTPGQPASIVTQDSPEPIRYEATQLSHVNLKNSYGHFVSAESAAVFALVESNGKPALSWNGQVFPLEPMSAGEFLGRGVPDEGQEFTLQLSAAGAELRYFTDGLRGLRFERSQPGPSGRTNTGSGN